CEGLTREQFAQPHPPSTLTLGGLLNHLALVEDSWFEVRFAGRPEDPEWAGIDWEADPDHEFRTAAELEPDELRRRYGDACRRSRDVVAAAESLDQLSAQPRGNDLGLLGRVPGPPLLDQLQPSRALGLRQLGRLALPGPDRDRPAGPRRRSRRSP